MSQIFHRKKLDDFSAANMTKIKTNVKKGEDGLVEQRSFVGWKYGPCREKKLKIALLNETDFKVKFKFKVENCVLQISVHPFLGWNIWQNSTRPFFSYIFQWNWKGKSKYVLFGRDKTIWNIWAQRFWGTQWSTLSISSWSSRTWCWDQLAFLPPKRETRKVVRPMLDLWILKLLCSFS